MIGKNSKIMRKPKRLIELYFGSGSENKHAKEKMARRNYVNKKMF